MTDDRTLVHLAGYAAIVAVLASATWSGALGAVVGWLFVLAAIVTLAREGIHRLGNRMRTEAEKAARRGSTATDGGMEWEGDRR